MLTIHLTGVFIIFVATIYDITADVNATSSVIPTHHGAGDTPEGPAPAIDEAMSNSTTKVAIMNINVRDDSRTANANVNSSDSKFDHHKFSTSTFGDTDVMSEKQSGATNSTGSMKSSSRDLEMTADSTTNSTIIPLNQTTRDPHYGHNHKRIQPPPTSFYVCLIFVKSVLFVVGVTGNTMILATIIKTKSMHKQTQNYFVFNLAITDLFILLVYLPYNVYKLLVPAWPFGKFACSYLLPIADIVPSISILTLVAISIDRYRAITGTLTQTLSVKWTVVLLVSLWVGCYLIVALPVSFVMVYVARLQICVVNFESNTQAKIYYTLRFVFFYLLPSIAIFLCYIRVNRTLRNSVRFLQRSVTGKPQMIRLKRQKRIMSMFFAIFLTFAVCFLPFNVFVMLFNYWPQIQQYTTMLFYSMKLASVIAIGNSVCNPIILYILSRVFRTKFQSYLPFLKWCGHRCAREDLASDKLTINNGGHRETVTSGVLDTPDHNNVSRRALLLMSPRVVIKQKFGHRLNRRHFPQLQQHDIQMEQEDELLENNNTISNEAL